MEMPRNLEAERALLGLLINSNQMLFPVTQLVSQTDFYEPWNGELFTLDPRPDRDVASGDARHPDE
jgi:replicative DNA helicase